MEFLSFIGHSIGVLVILYFIDSIFAWLMTLLQAPHFIWENSTAANIWSKIVMVVGGIIQFTYSSAALITLTGFEVSSTAHIIAQILLLVVFCYFSSAAAANNDTNTYDSLDTLWFMIKPLLAIPIYLIVFHNPAIINTQPTMLVLSFCEFASGFPIWLLIIADIAISYIFSFLTILILSLICGGKQ